MEEQEKPEITVQASDLPLSCPLPDSPVFKEHPRVYLPIETAKEVSCPYCGTRYVLK